MEEKVCVMKNTGEKYFIIIDVPEKIAEDIEETRKYICNWIDENLNQITEWE